MLRKIAIASFVIALAVCGTLLTRRFHPVSLVFFAPAFLPPVLSAIVACSPKRKRSAAVGAMVGSLAASAALIVGAAALLIDERLAHGMDGFFDFLAVAAVASLAGCVVIIAGFGVGALIGRSFAS